VCGLCVRAVCAGCVCGPCVRAVAVMLLQQLRLWPCVQLWPWRYVKAVAVAVDWSKGGPVDLAMLSCILGA